ncbi:MAG: sugar ABC transporter ATP-binding protein [Desulfobacteraceae bacterium]|nr:MAG: sugar ABC transporter ATP-binding protein [Desulfobacteraceae bacterium]
MESSRMNGLSPLLSLREISKSFNGVTALKSVSLDLFPGEILGLVGDNGAGKSTLVKVVSGVHAPDTGHLTVGGQRVDFKSYDARRARRLGIETVFQDRSLGEKQPLWRNIFVGRPITNRLGFIRVREQKRVTLEILNRHVGLRGAGISADAPVRHLSGGERQGMVIGRAMYFDARIIILDEPTTALSLKEVETVLSFFDAIAGRDKACIYISHNLSHVYRLSHRIVLMDRGKVAGEYHKNDLSLDELGANLMRLHSSVDGGR